MKRGAPKSGRITLKDVAALAGVSVQTVSHVLAETPNTRITEGTRERVRKAAAELNYRPNRHAQAIRAGRTNVVGVWIPINRPTISILRILQAISENANLTKHEIMIVGLDKTEAMLETGSRPTDWPVDGILTVDSGKAAIRYREDPSTASTPICVLGLEELTNGDRIAWDLYPGAKRVAQLMISRGRKHLVHVSPDWILRDFPREQRRRGYTEAMEEAGLEPRFISVSGETSVDAAIAVADWLKNGNHADGFFGFTDTFAIGAARACLKAGLTIPGDAVIWGTGDYPEGADFTIPISSLAAPFPQIVASAWKRLNERMSGEAPDENRLEMFEMNFIERESTG